MFGRYASDANSARQTRSLFLWGVCLVIIPLFSVFGRSLQRIARENIQADTLSMGIAVMLIVCATAASVWLLRRGELRRSLHLLWLLPLFGVSAYLVPFVEERLHFILFGAFGFLTMRVFGVSVGLVVCCLFSGLDEGLQWLLPDRVGDWRDVTMNILASGMGMTLAYLGEESGSRSH